MLYCTRTEQERAESVPLLYDTTTVLLLLPLPPYHLLLVLLASPPACFTAVLQQSDRALVRGRMLEIFQGLG